MSAKQDSKSKWVVTCQIRDKRDQLIDGAYSVEVVAGPRVEATDAACDKVLMAFPNANTIKCVTAIKT